MKVGVIGPTSPDQFADNILDSLNRMGLTAVALGDALPFRNRKLIGRLADSAGKLTAIQYQSQRALVRKAETYVLDLIICVQSVLLPEIVHQLSTRRTKVVLWFPDSVANLGRGLMFIAPYSAIFLKEPLLVRRARATLDLPAHYLPEACNPSWHRPEGQACSNPSIVVVGNMYPSRVRLLEMLAQRGLPLQLFGSGFPRWLATDLRRFHTGRHVTRNEKARVFREAGLVLNNVHPAEFEGVNCRLFEATGCGGAVLTEHRAELSRMFDTDREVLSFSAFDDLVEKAEFLLRDPQRAMMLGDAASRRAHEEHTYERRLQQMLEIVA